MEGDNGGKTPLHRACEGGHVDVVQLLVERGADLEAKNAAGKTALVIAAEVCFLPLFLFICFLFFYLFL